MATLDSLRSTLSRRDQTRDGLQAPISAPKYCVMYDVGREHHRTPWFCRHEHALRALAVMQQRYGEKNAIIYVD
jgi:hypothetical protein